MPKKKYNPTDIFLYFNDSGVIESISPELEESKKFIALDFDEQQKFSSSGFQIGNCMITFADDGSYEIKEVEKSIPPTVHSYIHIIRPMIDSREECLIQRMSNCWRFRLSPTVKKRILRDQNRNINFYICKKQDIHFLIRTIRFQLYDLVENDFIEVPYAYENENDLTKFSMVTEQYFKTYGLL
jgi:hypothetical protein